MRSEVGEWLATCVGSPICILLISWTLLIYQNQPSSCKRRIDLLVVAVLSESLAHQLALLFYAILTLIRPVNHFGELCSTLVWMLNSSSILQELTLTTIAIFSAISSEAARLSKNHLKYHIVCMSVVSACIGVTGVLNFEPQTCVFMAHEVSPKYGIFFNSLRGLLVITSILSIFFTFYKDACDKPKSELLKSISDLSDLSSKNSSTAFECQQNQNWDPSNVSCTSSSTNSRACLRKRKVVDEHNTYSTVYSILFVCYIFNHIPVLVISIRPDLLRGFCTPQNLATWLPLLQDALLPISLAIFDKMFCRYVATVYTKQDQARKMSNGGIDGKFRHFEQDAEYKLQLNLNHGLKFPLTNGSLYGRLHSHQNRGRNGTITMGIQHYPRSQSLQEENAYASLPAELTSFTSSTFEPRSENQTNTIKSTDQKLDRVRVNDNFEFAAKRRIGSTDVFGQNMENLVQLEDGCGYKFGNICRNHSSKGSLTEIREEGPKKHVQKIMVGLEKLSDLEASLEEAKYGCFGKDSHQFSLIPRTRTRNVNIVRRSHEPNMGQLHFEQDSGTYVKRGSRHVSSMEVRNGDYESSDDESCDLDAEEDFGDTISSCKSRSRSCCSVTTIANDDFEFFQRKEPKMELLPGRKSGEIVVGSTNVNMRTFTPRIIESNSNTPDNNANSRRNRMDTKPTIHSYHLKNKMVAGYSMNDLDKLNSGRKVTTLSVESLFKNSGISYLDNGEICRHDMGGSAPDFQKIFVTEFI